MGKLDWLKTGSADSIKKYNYKVFGVLEKIRLVPYTFDQKTGKVELMTGMWNRGFYYLTRTVSLCHTLHLSARYLYTLLFDHDLSQDLRYMMIVFGTEIILLQTALSYALGTKRDLIVMFLNNAMSLMRRNFNRSRRTQLTVYEQLARFFPFIINGVNAIYAFLYVLYPNFPILLVASVPQAHRNLWTTLGCLLLDTIGFATYVACADLFIYGVIIFIATFREDIRLDKADLENFAQNGGQNGGQNGDEGKSEGEGQVSTKLSKQVKWDSDVGESSVSKVKGSKGGKSETYKMVIMVTKISKATKLPRIKKPASVDCAEQTLGACKDLTESRLRVLLFNLGLAFIVYLGKLICMIGGVGGGFLSIRFMNKDGFLSGIALTAGVIATLGYIAAFNEAFQITDDVEQFKTQIILKAQQIPDPVKRKEVKLRLRSITQIAIKQGSFNKMERASTPMFVSYVIQQIVDLLLTTSK